MKDAFDAILQPKQAKYLESLEPARDPLLAEMEAYAHAQRMPISDPEVASFLAVTARAIGARSIVELGTNIGYGAIVLARAAGPGAKVVTYELKPQTASIARGYIERAGLADVIEVREADALAGIAAFEGSIDLLYVDCVKEHYPQYLEHALPKLSERGVVVADNVLWKGHTADPDIVDADVIAFRRFNRMIVSDPRLHGVVLPLGDGVGYAVRL